MENEQLMPILQALESFDSGRIGDALQQADKSAELKQRLEKRYLKLIQTLLDNPDAVLADFPKAFATEARVEKTRDDVFVDNSKKMEFVYFSAEEARDAVDIIGSIVANHINPQQYIDFCQNTSELNEIGKSLFPMIEALKNGIHEEVEAYPGGWYGQICIHIMKALFNNVGEFVIMKTWVKKANMSTVLKEFNFFLAAAATEDYMFIEFRNIMDHALDFTEVLWLSPNTPLLFYPANYEQIFPKCVLPYNRMVRMIKFSEFYEPDGSINVGNMIARDGLQEINSEDL